MSKKYLRTLHSIPSLVALVGFGWLTLPAQAGEKIIFSAPGVLALPSVEHIEKTDTRGIPASSAAFNQVDPGFGVVGPISVIIPARHSRHSGQTDHVLNRNKDRDSDTDSNRAGDLDSNNGEDRDVTLNRENDLDRRNDFNRTGDERVGSSDRPQSKYSPTAQGSFGSVTNRWEMGKSWTANSSKDSTGMRRAADENSHALRESALGAWRNRSSAPDEKEEEDTTWKAGSSGGFGRSFLSRAFDSHLSSWDRSTHKDTDRPKTDDYKSMFQWSERSTPTEPAAFGSTDWLRRDTDSEFKSTFAPIGGRSLQSDLPKPDDQVGSYFGDNAGLQAPNLGAPSYSDLLPSQAVVAQPTLVAPSAPTMLPLPRMPGSVFR